MNKSEKYTYYIFMDDDIFLTAKVTGNPWRAFEDFLRRIEPAVGAVDTNRLRCVPLSYRVRLLLGCSLKGTQEYIPAVRYDGALNAFHYQAVEYILPYSLKFDNTSWWLAHWYVIIKSRIVLPGQVVLHTGIVAVNPKRRPYRRKVPSAHDVQGMVKLVQADLPGKYQNALDWTHRSPDNCLPPPPPKKPIKPFGYIEAMQNRNMKASEYL